MKWHWLSCKKCRVYAITKKHRFNTKIVCPICKLTDNLTSTEQLNLTVDEAITNFKFFNFLQGNKNND